MSQQSERKRFRCPNCGQEDREFFEEIYIMKISRGDFLNLTEEQRQYVNPNMEYGVLLCEECQGKAKRYAWIIKGSYILGIILLGILPPAALCVIPVVWYLKKFPPIKDSGFNHAWECGAVKRVAAD